MKEQAPRLPLKPDIRFDETGLIYHDGFSDSYYSRDNGLEETRHVFHKGCNLPDAWSGTECFVIGELGFGTGLNALASWDLWRRNRPPGGILHFISVEAFLMSADQARQALSLWPELADLSAKLLQRWPVRSFGAQRIWFPEDGFCLTLLIGEAHDALSRQDFGADAWFLDGFAPSRNSDMWSSAIFTQVARLSRPSAKLASYSVAGFVRRGLADAGFQINRVAGFAHKRECLQGVFTGAQAPRPPRPKTAIIIGGGIAAAATCAAMARRGIQAEVFDSDTCGRTKASGNPAALIMPRLDRGDTREARFFRAAALMAFDFYGQLDSQSFQQTGVEERAKDAKDEGRLLDLGTNPPLPDSHLMPLENGGLLHLAGGLAFPDKILQGLFQGHSPHPKKVGRIGQVGSDWCAFDEQGIEVARADICIIAAGPQIDQLLPGSFKLEGRAGQLSLLPKGPDLPARPIAGGPYAAAFHDYLLFGATFWPWALIDAPPTPTLEGHQENLQNLSRIAPELTATGDLETAIGRSSVRAATTDRLPIAGQVPERPETLFVLGGLGARGFTTAYLCAELVASLACGEPIPTERVVELALSPSRFLKNKNERPKDKL